MSRQYERPQARGGGLRLHLNENTAGCSPRVQRVLRDLTREDAAFYPDYDAAIAASAAHFGISIEGRSLQATDLDWSYGSGPALRGRAEDLALVLCGRVIPEGPLDVGVRQPGEVMPVAEPIPCADTNGRTSRVPSGIRRP